MNKDNKVCKLEIADMTKEQARTWLIANDREASEFWRTCPDNDLIDAVKDCLNDFGWDNQLGEVIISQSVKTDKKQIKTAELAGKALDWAVAKSLGYFGSQRMTNAEGQLLNLNSFQPSVRLDQAGDIIEREMIAISNPRGVGWQAEVWHEHVDPTTGHHSYGAGETFLFAAMRCFVTSKLGREIQVPEEILTSEPTYNPGDIVDVLKAEIAHGYALTIGGVAQCVDEIVSLRDQVSTLNEDLAQQVRECQRLNKLANDTDDGSDSVAPTNKPRR